MGTKKYSLAQDLFLLAAKSFNNGDTKSAAKLFVHACSSKDLPIFIDQAMASDGEKGFTLAQVSSRVIAQTEIDLAESSGPLSVVELRTILGQIKKHHATACDCIEDCEDCMCHASDHLDEEQELLSGMDSSEDDFSLEVDSELDEDEDENEGCSDCDSNPCECDHSVEGTKETEISTTMNTLDDELKTSLVSLKIRANDWDVKKFMPTLLSFFPTLVVHPETPIGKVVTLVMNQVKSLDIRSQVKLNKALQSIKENN